MGPGGKNKKARGFTLIEMMVVVTIVGLLASAAVPAFMIELRRTKTSEARSMVRYIYNAAREYYMEQHTNPATSMPIPPQFPVSALKGDDDDYFAHDDCCAVGGEEEKCPPIESIWDGNPSWQVLHFGVPEAHYYAYKYISEQGPAGATNGTHNFTAYARGDLDCDGDFSFFTMFGQVNSIYSDGPTGTSILRRINELE